MFCHEVWVADGLADSLAKQGVVRTVPWKVLLFLLLVGICLLYPVLLRL